MDLLPIEDVLDVATKITTTLNELSIKDLTKLRDRDVSDFECLIDELEKTYKILKLINEY